MLTSPRAPWLGPAIAAAATLATAVLAVLAHRRWYAAEAGSRAGAEPALAGLVVAAPYVALVLAQVVCVLLATRRSGWAAAAVALLAVGLAATLLRP